MKIAKLWSTNLLVDLQNGCFLQTLKKIQTLERQKDDNLTLIIDLERDLKRTKDENDKQITENAKLVENMLTLRKEMDSLA